MEIKKVVPAAVAEAPAPAIVAVPEPELSGESESSKAVATSSIIAALDAMETDSEPEKAELEEIPVNEIDEAPPETGLTSLLASLGSHSDQTVPEPEEGELSADAADLAAYINDLEAEPAANELIEPSSMDDADLKIIEDTTISPDEPVQYVSTDKSAKKIEELLLANQPKTSATLGSFLDGIVEDINEKN